MMRKQFLAHLCLLISFCVVQLHAPEASGRATIAKTINVNVNGGGDFTSIQQALNSIPDGNDQWVQVHVAAGVYREQLNISSFKSKILLVGDGHQQTSVEWGDPQRQGIDTRAVITSLAIDFVAANIAFKNTYDGPVVTQALAAAVMGDKSAFYFCSFSGVQDTLLDGLGRHYFRSCYIEGAYDFIYGNGQSIYENCTISTVNSVVVPGFITAHGRSRPDDPSGFVFKDCNVTGPQATYLGRAWRPYARVIFYRTSMSDVVVPLGWEAWTAQGREYGTTFAEADCSGPGSNLTGRVNWLKKMSGSELEFFINKNSFIDEEGWIEEQPWIL